MSQYCHQMSLNVVYHLYDGENIIISCVYLFDDVMNIISVRIKALYSNT
jgi:hypothetical protein